MFLCKTFVLFVLVRGSIADPVFSGFFLVAHAAKIYAVGICTVFDQQAYHFEGTLIGCLVQGCPDLKKRPEP